MKRLAPLFVLLLAGGCRMCASSCDYSPTVPGGPPLGLARAGSNLSGGYYAVEPTAPAVEADSVGEAAMAPQMETAAVEAPPPEAPAEVQ